MLNSKKEMTYPNSTNKGIDLLVALANAGQASTAALRERVTNVRYAPLEHASKHKCECIYFEFDGHAHLGELRGRNRDLCIDMTNPNAEANKAIALRVMLDQHHFQLTPESATGSTDTTLEPLKENEGGDAPNQLTQGDH
jgi:hypothetical protein